MTKTITERIMFFDEERREWVVDTVEIELEEENSQPVQDENDNFVTHQTLAYV